VASAWQGGSFLGEKLSAPYSVSTAIKFAVIRWKYRDDRAGSRDRRLYRLSRQLQTLHIENSF
jgi:hypothetical protein